jgi:hypothetical protein
MRSLTYLACFSLKVFFHPIYTDYAYFEKKITLIISATIKLISIFGNGRNFEWKAVLSGIILNVNHPMTILAKLC